MLDGDVPRPENKMRGPRNHLRHGARAFAPPSLGRDTLCERAARWILPWTVRNYPGLRRGLVELMGTHVTYSAIKGYRTGRRPLPRWVADWMAATIRARCSKGMALAAELDEWGRQRARIEDKRRELKRRQLNAFRGRSVAAQPSD
jgi:hypothetical protein